MSAITNYFCQIYENVDIIFIEIYRIHSVFWKWFSRKVITLIKETKDVYKDVYTRPLKKLIRNKNGAINRSSQSTKATFNQMNFWCIYSHFCEIFSYLIWSFICKGCQCTAQERIWPINFFYILISIQVTIAFYL